LGIESSTKLSFYISIIIYSYLEATYKYYPLITNNTF